MGIVAWRLLIKIGQDDGQKTEFQVGEFGVRIMIYERRQERERILHIKYAIPLKIDILSHSVLLLKCINTGFGNHSINRLR